MHYFAYGSNMDPDQMRRRCPKARPIARACVRGWEFYVNSRGVASIGKDRYGVVMGVIYRLTPACVASLDRHEGFHLGIYGKFFLPAQTLKTGKTRWCLTYIDPTQDEGSPRKGYMEKILRGALHFNLPPTYVHQLNHWRK